MIAPLLSRFCYKYLNETRVFSLQPATKSRGLSQKQSCAVSKIVRLLHQARQTLAHTCAQMAKDRIQKEKRL